MQTQFSDVLKGDDLFWMFKGILNIASTPTFRTINTVLNSKVSESGLTKDMTQKFGSEFSAQKYVSTDFKFQVNRLKCCVTVTILLYNQQMQNLKKKCFCIFLTDRFCICIKRIQHQIASYKHGIKKYLLWPI